MGCSSCKSNKQTGDEKKLGGIQKRLNEVLKNKAGTTTPGKAAPMKPPPVMKQPFTDQLRALLKKDDAKKRTSLITAIGRAPKNFRVPLLGEGIAGVGLSPDKWTQNGEPAGILITNTGKKAAAHTMEISCGAPPKKFPITITVDDGKHKQKVVLKEIGFKTIKLSPVAAGSKKLFIITTDKTWTPGTQDRRVLGVRILFPVRKLLADLFKNGSAAARKNLQRMVLKHEISDNVTQLASHTLALGLEGDFFTSSGPAALIVTSEGKKPQRTELTFSCSAPQKDLPLTATIHGPRGKQRLVFRKAEQQLAVLPTVAAGQSELFFVTTSKTWTPTHDKERKLGVRITNSLDYTLRSLLKRPNPTRRTKLVDEILDEVVEKTFLFGDNVVSVGLSGDRWTVSGEPAGIAIRNDFTMTFPLQLFISCGAPTKDMPVTAIIDDGTDKTRIVFKNPGAKLVDLKSLPSGSKKLFIITTDKTWTPGTHDKRMLGVNVGIVLAPLLKTLSEGKAGAADLKTFGKAIFNGDPIGKVDLVEQSVAAVGLSLDRWTEEGKPAAVAFRNVHAKAWTPTLGLMTSNRLSDLPIKAYIWDGSTTKTVVFKGPVVSVKLSPVPSNGLKTYIFTTDKTFKSPLDSRQLGVQVGVHGDEAKTKAPPKPAKATKAKAKATKAKAAPKATPKK